MKLSAAQVAGFLRDPGACRVVLLYGDDLGMIRERAAGLVRLVIGASDDPFRMVDLAPDAVAELPNEAASLSLSGGRRVVRVREVTDAAMPHVQALLKGNADALVVLEGPSLAARSRLRTLLEAAPDGAVIGCYPEEGRALETTVRDTLKEHGVTVDPDALAWLVANLGADRASTRAELEKLALYVGPSGGPSGEPSGRVDLDSAMACVGDLAGLSLDDALFAATAGDVTTTDRALELAMAEGAAPVQILRAATYHLQRLHRCRIVADGGTSIADAVKAARPPVFFRRVGSFTRAVGLWRSAALDAALTAVAEAERGCKRTGWPDDTLCRHTILALARRARVMGRPA